MGLNKEDNSALRAGEELLAVTPLVPTPLPGGMAARARLSAIILAVPFNTLLLLDFARTVASTFTFHTWCSFPKD